MGGRGVFAVSNSVLDGFSVFTLFGGHNFVVVKLKYWPSEDLTLGFRPWFRNIFIWYVGLGIEVKACIRIVGYGNRGGYRGGGLFLELGVV